MVISDLLSSSLFDSFSSSFPGFFDVSSDLFIRSFSVLLNGVWVGIELVVKVLLACVVFMEALLGCVVL